MMKICHVPWTCGLFMHVKCGILLVINGEMFFDKKVKKLVGK